MKAIMVMFDSLNRHMLPPYGNNWVCAPNFNRLATKSVQFMNAYAGSLPCMPARRELHTGRYNFLHRSWGPIEPFDDSMPQILRENGVHSHLVSDHYHYWEDGGCTYHTRYNTWELSRGQEADPWKAVLADSIPVPDSENNKNLSKGSSRIYQDWVNRHAMQEESKQPMPKTFSMALEFLETNNQADNWFLQIETFDPHEPFYVPEKYIQLYSDIYSGKHADWPDCRRYTDQHELVQHFRYVYAALVSMCDHYLGKVLDAMDEYDLWQDTMLIVNTDHGFLLGEHEYCGKCVMPFYNEIAHIPLFIWDPRSAAADEKRSSFVQTIDLAPTLLDFFGQPLTKDMQGRSLEHTIQSDAQVREAGLFGIHGGQVNVTDGRYVYMRSAGNHDNKPLYNYTHMPTYMRQPITIGELQQTELVPPFSFTKNCPIMKIPAYNTHYKGDVFKTVLYDLEADPVQEHPLENPEIENKMMDYLIDLMRANDAPAEQYRRLGLEKRHI